MKQIPPWEMKFFKQDKQDNPVLNFPDHHGFRGAYVSPQVKMK